MKPYIGCFIPKKGPAEKLNLQTISILKNAPNKKAAGAIITGDFFQEYPEIAECYFDVKVIEDIAGNDRPAFNEWSTDFIWNKETGSIQLIPVNKDEDNASNTVTDEPEFVGASKLPTNVRAALLALFGRTDAIAKAEYSQAIDLTNDDMPSFARELGEAITRTPRVLALLPDRQAELLDAVRDHLRESAQWTEIKKFMDKWLDMPPVKRDAPVEAAPEYVSLTFVQKIAVVINAPNVELDEVTPEILSDATNQRKCEYPAFIRAQKALTYIQPTLEKYSDRLLGNAIRSVDFNEDKGIVAYRRAVLDYLGVNDDAEQEDENEQNTQNTTSILVADNSENGKLAENAAGDGESAQEVKPGRSIFSLDEILAGPDENRLPMNDREIVIAYAVDDLVSGHTGVMSKDEAQGVITCTGHLISVVLPLIVADIATTEFCLSPDFSDEEIHHVATSILDAWSDNEAKRQIVALDAITELRTELPAPAIFEEPVVKPKPRIEPEETPTPVIHASSAPGLTYRQQLTIAAIQGLCANPASFGVFDEIVEMAITLASAADRENV
jgi:exodeoxyribonuclease VIII